ncbi:MAG: DUF2292 domain-containing protein [Pirellulales bacterium]|nr:DUF2292 domain-containing protein [Pirellulales bacterium]
MSESASPNGARPQVVEQGRDEPWLPLLRELLRGLQFGSVVITVQDRVVVQVDRTEKHRLRRA